MTTRPLNDVSDADLAAAKKRGAAKANRPTALVSVVLDEADRTLRLRFRAGVQLEVPIAAIEEVADAPLAQLRDVAASPLDDGLVFREYGEAIYVPGLIHGLFPSLGGRNRW